MNQRDPQDPRIPQTQSGVGQPPYTPTATANAQSAQQRQESGSNQADQAKEKAGQAADQAKEKAGQAREKVGAMASTATTAVDERRGQASEAMDTAAVQLRERGESMPGGERTTEMASMAADKVEATSQYVREHDVQDMMSDLEILVRKHPTQSLVVAAAAGFMVGRMLRS